MLDKEETRSLKEWLADSDDRRVILDEVYNYACKFDPYTHELLETEKTIVVHSLSKAWLERGVFGVVIAPQENVDDYREILRSPPQEQCNFAFVALKNQPNMPYEQQRDFSREWNRLSPVIRAFAPNFQAPKTGYFSTIPVQYKKVLEEFNALVIPATVFGSEKVDVSIVSCLHDINPKNIPNSPV